MRLILNKALDTINDSVNIKIIEITSADFLNNDLDYFVYKYQIPLIKFTDTEEIFNIKNFKSELSSSLSETEIILDENDLELISSGSGGGSQDLQSVLDSGNESTTILRVIEEGASTEIYAGGINCVNSIGIVTLGSIDEDLMGTNNNTTGQNLLILSDRAIGDRNTFRFPPNKPSGDHIIATLDDIPTGGTQDLQSVLDAGNIATTPIVIKADTEAGTTIKSTIGTQGISMEVKEGSVGNMVTFGASNIELYSWDEPYSSWIGTASLNSLRNPLTGNSYGILTLNDGLNHAAYLMAHPPVDGVSVAGGEFYLPRKKEGITTPRTLATLDDILNINLDSRVYANNAAAISGGLVAKDLYRTATGELRVVV